jgi:hypothetical protein
MLGLNNNYSKFISSSFSSFRVKKKNASSPKRRYPTTSLQNVRSQKTSICRRVAVTKQIIFMKLYFPKICV